MLLFGHRFIESENFYHIVDSSSIEKTPPCSTLYIEFSEENLEIILFAKESGVEFLLCVADITELIYANALGATYIEVSNTLAKTAQKIAENYLFDAKILTLISSDEEIEEMALLGIDGVLFSNAIIKVNS